MKLYTVSLLTGALFLANTAFGSPVIIDTFNTCANSVSQTGAGNSSSGISCTDSIGLNRIDQLVITGTAGITSTLNANPPAGVISGNIDSGHTGTTFLIWSGSSTNALAFGLGGVDLTAAGLNTGLVVNTQSDQAGSIRITINTGLGQYSHQTQAIPGNGFSSGFAEIIFPFANFTIGAGAGTNPNSVNSVTLTVTGPAGQDWVINDVYAAGVPEPASMAMIAGGLLALGAIRRRR